MSLQKPKILIIVGPTASGKSDLAIKLAKKYHGEIISADSRQVYRSLDIGTGKITKKEMRGIPHHLLDVASPKRQFTVTRFQKLGQIAIKKILKKGKLPIIVGGTGLYIDALVNNVILPEVKPNLKLRKRLDKLTAKKLFAMLRKLDPKRAHDIDHHNKRRLIRALEIVLTTGQKVSILKLSRSHKYKFLKVGIKLSDSELKQKIHVRLIKRLRQGPPKFLYGKIRRINMITEVEMLHKYEKVSWKKLDELGLEYRYVSRYLQNLVQIDACTLVRSQYNASSKKLAKQRLLKEMIEKLETEIWHYAKRQMTWFARPHFGIKNETRWIANFSQIEALVKKFLEKKKLPLGQL